MSLLRLVVDGVGFQAGDALAEHFWEPVLAGLARDLDVVLLDRGNTPDIAGVRRLPFPDWSGRETAADSLLLEEVCQALAAGFFLSTGCTTPVRTPSIAVIQGLLPPKAAELERGSTGADRQRLEDEAAILHARRRIFVTPDEIAMLARSAPELHEYRNSLVEHGADPLLFHPREKGELTPLAQRLGLSNDFVVIVEDAFTDPALRRELAAKPEFGELDWIFVCGGSRPAAAPPESTAGRAGFAPSARELSVLLSAAAAIAIAPNVRMLPLWADAALKCRCPVLLHDASTYSKRWRASATLFKDHWSAAAIVKAARAAPSRSALPAVASGLPHAPERLAAEIVRVLREVRIEVDRGAHDAFYETWTALRQIQARVDF